VLEFRVNPRRVSTAGEPIPIFDGPVALLVDGMTASTSEIFAAGLQDVARARVFGETTMGAALPALLERMPNGDLLMHAIADFLRPGGGRIEGHGVVPDEEVPLTREALAVDSDPPLEAALRWIDRAEAEAEDDSGSSE
jgi:carboxyl-terminal processing protease